MKFFSKLLLVAVLLQGLISCGKDPNEPDKPVMSATPASISAEPGEKVTIKLTMSSNSTLKSLTVKSSINGSPAGQLDDTTFSGKNSISYNYVYNVSSTAKASDKITLTFTVSDNAGTSSSDDVVINVVAASKLCSNIVLGAQGNSNDPSFYDAEGCQTFLVSQALNNQSKVDIVYYYGNTNYASLGAPDDAGVNEFKTAYQMDAWTTKNATRFKKLTAGFNITTATSSQIQEAWNNGGTEKSSITELIPTDLIAFKTVNGKYGVLQVTAISAGSTGKITFTAKIQQ